MSHLPGLEPGSPNWQSWLCDNVMRKITAACSPMQPACNMWILGFLARIALWERNIKFTSGSEKDDHTLVSA